MSILLYIYRLDTKKLNVYFAKYVLFAMFYCIVLSFILCNFSVKVHKTVHFKNIIFVCKEKESTSKI